jgi:hypothetical protein
MLFARQATGTEYSKGKVCPRTDHEGPEEENRYRYILSVTSAPDTEVGG